MSVFFYMSISVRNAGMINTYPPVFYVCVNSKMMDVCGEAESRLATELMQHEVQIERDILDPLNQLAEVKQTVTLFIFY